jgi:multiple RNA-binding domain-containing protein 1
MIDKTSSHGGKQHGGLEDKRLLLSKTRVCIKNLSANITERDLKDYLLRKGINNKLDVTLQITDCRILKNEKGRSRKVAFVGFRTADQAEYAVQTFHRAFLKMTRITVEPALARKEPAENERTLSSTSRTIDKETEKGKWSFENDALEAKDNTVQRVIHGKPSKATFWSNDDLVDPVATSHSSKATVLHVNDDGSENNSSDCSGCSSSGSQVIENDSNYESYNFLNDANNHITSDIGFLRSKQKKSYDLEEAGVSSVERGDQSSIGSSSSSSVDVSGRKVTTDKNRNGTEGDFNATGTNEKTDDNNSLSGTRLFVRNLPFATTEQELEEYFSPFGQIVECHIPLDDHNRNKGYAFVTFESPVDATEAKLQLDQLDFQGRLLHILIALQPHTTESFSSSSWKKWQEKSRKEVETKDAGKAAQGWSASFVRGDAVVDNLAERLGLRKGEVLGVKGHLSSGDAAVMLALGETQIIEENRAFFRQKGINMDVLVSSNAIKANEKPITRSKTAFLVKNLPFDTRLEELTKLFHSGEVPVDVLLPPSRTIALVVFLHAADAKKAFRKLAYRRFKHVPIFLEWAPVEASAPFQEKTPNGLAGDSTEEIAFHTGAGGGAKDDEQGVSEVISDTFSSTLYVKNLNFATTEQCLQNVFENAVGSEVKSVRIPRKIAPTKRMTTTENRPESMGYGFVELSTTEIARKAVKLLRGKLIDGHPIQLVPIKKNATPTCPLLEKKHPTKIIVRNVPFQATRQELLKLFGTFGQLRKVRLPKKFDGRHRGFAFVEFLTGKEALAAICGLSRTHLYGRHLVLEWASDERNHVDFLRDKAERDVKDVPSVPQNKKIRFS